MLSGDFLAARSDRRIEAMMPAGRFFVVFRKYEQFRQQGQGTGVILSSDGFLRFVFLRTR